MKLIATVFLLCALASSARADDESYAKRVVIADAVTTAVLGTGLVIFATTEFGEYDQGARAGAVASILVIGGLASYLVTPQILHAQRGNTRGLLRSAVTRVGLPMVVGLVGAAIGDENGAALGAGVGLVTAMVLDWTVYAKHTRPFVVPTRDGVTVGFARTF
jgi:hypothetical protein